MFAKEQQKSTNYTVKNVKTVAAGKDVQARLFTLAPGEVIPWQCASKARIISGGRFHPESCRLIRKLTSGFCWVTG